MLATSKTPSREEKTPTLYRAFSRRDGPPRTYAACIAPQEARRLAELGAVEIVDLRTAFEREYVGHVPDTLHVEWLPLGPTQPHPGFIAAPRAEAEPKEAPVVLCRSVNRPAAAAAAPGFGCVLDVICGVAGDLDEPTRQARRRAQGRAAVDTGSRAGNVRTTGLVRALRSRSKCGQPVTRGLRPRTPVRVTPKAYADQLTCRSRPSQ